METNKKTYKICDVNRGNKKGIVASSLENLIDRTREKFGFIAKKLTLVLESDGTEVDDEDYFSTLDSSTTLMILNENEKWALPKSEISLDETDDVDGKKRELANLVNFVLNNNFYLSLLDEPELELLSDIDIDSFADTVTNTNKKMMLEHIKEASNRIILEKCEAQDAIALLKLYQSVVSTRKDVSSNVTNESENAVATAKLQRTANESEDASTSKLLRKRKAQDELQITTPILEKKAQLAVWSPKTNKGDAIESVPPSKTSQNIYRVREQQTRFVIKSLKVLEDFASEIDNESKMLEEKAQLAVCSQKPDKVDAVEPAPPSKMSGKQKKYLMESLEVLEDFVGGLDNDWLSKMVASKKEFLTNTYKLNQSVGKKPEDLPLTKMLEEKAAVWSPKIDKIDAIEPVSPSKMFEPRGEQVMKSLKVIEDLASELGDDSLAKAVETQKTFLLKTFNINLSAGKNSEELSSTKMLEKETELASRSPKSIKGDAIEPVPPSKMLGPQKKDVIKSLKVLEDFASKLDDDALSERVKTQKQFLTKIFKLNQRDGKKPDDLSSNKMLEEKAQLAVWSPKTDKVDAVETVSPSKYKHKSLIKMNQQNKKSRYLENLKRHILPRSKNQMDFNLARLEWELEYIELSEELGNCPCGKENIREHCFIRNKHTRKLTYVGNVCVNKFLNIKTGNLFSGLKRIHKDPDARPNAELIKYAMKKGFIYEENEYKFLHDIKNKRKLSDKQLSWLHKINRRITESIVVQRRSDLPTDKCEGDRSRDEIDSDDYHNSD